jgi:hypothetical protein
MRTKPTASSPLDTCTYVFQCECEPRQHARRDRTTFSTRYRLEFVASQCQHAERACVRIDDSVFRHAEAGVERSFGIEIAAPCSRRENFHDEIGSSVDGLQANDYEGHRRDDQLPVNQLLPVTLMLLGDQLEVFER